MCSIKKKKIVMKNINDTGNHIIFLKTSKINSKKII